MHTTWQNTIFYVALFCLLTSSIVLSSIIVKAFPLTFAYSVAAITFLVIAWLCLLLCILIDEYMPALDYFLTSVFIVALLIAVVMEWLIIPFNAMESPLYKYALSSGVLSLVALVLGIIGVALWLWMTMTKRSSNSRGGMQASESPLPEKTHRYKSKHNYSKELEKMSEKWKKLMKSPTPY